MAMGSLRDAGLLPTKKEFSLSEMPQLSGKVAVVTGGQTGIGEEITAQLLLHGVAKVYVLARTEEKFVAAQEDWALQQGLDADDVSQRTEFVQCDLSSIKATGDAAQALLKKIDRLDLLFANAALPPQSSYELSPDGIDTVFAANYLGHFVLTNILLPLIEYTAASFEQSRIIVTTSSLYVLCQEISLDSLTSTTPPKSPAVYDGWWRYGRSKLADILLTRYLAKLESGKGYPVYPNCFFPGNIATDAMDTWKDMIGSGLGSIPKEIFKYIGQSPVDGATTAMYLAASDDVVTKDLKGQYFVPVAADAGLDSVALDNDLMNNLWYWSGHKVTEVLGKGWEDMGKSSLPQPAGQP